MRVNPKPEPFAETGVECSQVQPLGDRVILRRDDPEKVTEGGIVIPDIGRELKVTGVLVAKGPDVPDNIELGERFMVAKYPPLEFEIAGKTYLVLYSPDLMCRVRQGVEIGRVE